MRPLSCHQLARQFHRSRCVIAVTVCVDLIWIGLNHVRTHRGKLGQYQWHPNFGVLQNDQAEQSNGS